MLDEKDLKQRCTSQPESSDKTPKCIERRHFYYLFDSYKRLRQSAAKSKELDEKLEEHCRSLIVNIGRTIVNIMFEPDKSKASQLHQQQQLDDESTPSGGDWQLNAIRQKELDTDLSVQFTCLLVDNYWPASDDLIAVAANTSNVESEPYASKGGRNFAIYYEYLSRFLNLFDESEAVRRSLCNENKRLIDSLYKKNTESPARLNNALLTEQAALDECELQFLLNVFAHLNTHLISIDKCDFYSSDYFKYIELVRLLTETSLMKYLLLVDAHRSVEESSNGRRVQVCTILGKLMSPHLLPTARRKKQAATASASSLASFMQLLSGGGPAGLFEIEYGYFNEPTKLTKRDIEINEELVWKRQRALNAQQADFFYKHLIKSARSNRAIRHMWLRWLGEAFRLNRAKMQEWTNYQQGGMSGSGGSLMLGKFASDGFLLNAFELLLNYSMPFCGATNSRSSLLLKIDISYTQPSTYRCFAGFEKETMLTTVDDLRPASTQLNSEPIEYNFITECFYATHECARLAFVGLHSRLMKLNNELARWQSTYQQLINSSSLSGAHLDEQMSRLKELYEKMTVEFLNIKTALLNEELLEKMCKFLCASCSFMVHLALSGGDDLSDVSALCELRNVAQLDKLREPSEATRHRVSKIPEYFLTNVADFFIFVGRFKEAFIGHVFANKLKQNETDNVNNQPKDDLHSLVSLVLIYMGNSKLLFNPHCRASLAELAELFIWKPRGEDYSSRSNKKELAYAAFLAHPCASYACESLLNVFVTIEMTGQSVAFEQKFNYRRPMYELIEFLWNMPVLYANDQASESYESNVSLLELHRQKLEQLADIAYANIENIEQPLFVKFLNYLINDANYLLLEGLLYLEKIKTAQDKLAGVYINSEGHIEPPPSSQQRSETESNLKHMIMMAKFHNFMSTKTIHTINLLTSRIKHIFCHAMFVDRLATMLNDFLLHLVGKKKRKQLKVNNFKEVEFNPREVVSNICDIYLNLSTQEAFCEAVCRDGRSYSNELFELALGVLVKIGREQNVIDDFAKLKEKLDELSKKLMSDEMSYDDAPDDYLDPIMSILMNDPVMLPSSKKIVDKSTIARHLLR
jgi:hypothetical protein